MTVPSHAAGVERLAELEALAAPARTKRMLVIVNPHAATMSDRLKQLVVFALQGRYQVDAVDTQRKGHAIEICREAAGEGYDVVLAFGGDGTVNEAANGLAGSETPLTCLPGGSNNVVCKILGIPVDLVDATEHLLLLADAWQPRRMDLGRLDDRWFTFSAGMGLDASVVERVDSHPSLKARFGAWYFTEVAVRTFLRRYVINPPRVEVEANGQAFRGVSAFVQNAHPYTYFRNLPIDVAEGAEVDSGDLAGAVLERASAIDMPLLIWRLLSQRARVVNHRRVGSFAGVTGVRARSADGRPVPVQVDGDYLGDRTAVDFAVAPGALTVVA